MNHVWDDIMHEIGKVMAPGNSWKYQYWERKRHMNITTLLEIAKDGFDAPEQLRFK